MNGSGKESIVLKPLDWHSYLSEHLSFGQCMTTWQALVLGIIQGITEFLPVSSSGHLALAQYLLGFDHLQDYIFFNLICHLGTLCAIFAIFFNAIKESFTTRSVLLWKIALATLPLFPLVLILKPIKETFNRPELLGPFFLVSSSLLFAGVFLKFPFSYSPRRKWSDPLTIGLFQAAAIFPGISRSGATISSAQLLGWKKEEAIQFSFLLAIPTILGGALLEGVQLWHSSQTIFSLLDFSIFAIGFLTSFLVGLFSLKLLIRLVIQEKWIYFAWYCLTIGLLTSIYFNFIV